MAFKRVMVLLWADIFAGYAIWVVQTYLTNVWNLGFTHAAGIMNVFSGLSKALPLFFVLSVDAFLGNYSMLLVSTMACVVGLGFMSMSTPPVLSKSSGTCRNYKPECIGPTQKALFYTGLALIAVGVAGHIVSLVAFSAEQLEEPTEEQPEVDEAQDQTQNQAQDSPEDIQFEPVDAMLAYVTQHKINSFRICLLVLVPIVGVIALPYIKPWSIRFGLPAIFTLVAALFFLSGSFSYKYRKPQGSPVTSVFRVLVASCRKIFHKLPNTPELHGYKECGGQNTRGLRFLEKAAIVLDPKSLEELGKNRWRICTVEEVEEAKFIIRLIPFWMSFIICGLISSIGNTYFVEQANHMSYKVGKIKAPITILLVLYNASKPVFTSFYKSMADCLGVFGRKYAPLVGISMAIIFSVLCCITASKVETRRLSVINSHRLLDKPEEKIPMSAFWLLPQFILLAGLDSFFENSVASFCNDQAPPSMTKYILYFTHGISGLGMVGSVLSVYVVGRVSEKGGNQNWFQYTLNRSRLDNYYWVLSVIGAANFVWFVLIAAMYRYRKFA